MEHPRLVQLTPSRQAPATRRRHPARKAVLAGAALLAAALLAPAAPAQETLDEFDVIYDVLETRTDDLPGLIEIGRIRVLVPYDRTSFFVAGARPRGITYEMFQAYEEFLAKRLGQDAQQVDVVFLPLPLDWIVPYLEQGYGDIAAAKLTVTPERQALVDFTSPLATDIDQIVVTHADVEPPATIEGLAGRSIWVTAGSSYVEHLAQLSAELEQRGLEPINVIEADNRLGTEDVLEMVHAGILELTVADAYLADLWAEVLDGLRPQPELKVHEGGEIAWAIRKDSPELMASLNEFVAEAREGTLLGNVLIKRYIGSTKWITDPTSEAERRKLEEYERIFRDAAAVHGFDWLLLAAQAYQESGLVSDRRSASGALGLMQLMPATAEELGCDDPLDPEKNVLAGALYMSRLVGRFVDEPQLDPATRFDFALASYNAGPARVARWRERAPDRGLDPDRWFGHVERMAREDVGRETPRYVANVRKYYVAYRLAWGLLEDRAALVPAGARRR